MHLLNFWTGYKPTHLHREIQSESNLLRLLWLLSFKLLQLHLGNFILYKSLNKLNVSAILGIGLDSLTIYLN